jgi:isoquinoline 1-oxidoreductase subunit beta
MSSDLTGSTPSRRRFLQGSAGLGAFVFSFYLPSGGALAAKMTDPPMPNAFIRIMPDSTVTVMVKHLEMGQGISTGLATIVAEELDADWRQMRFAFAPANATLYNNLFFGPLQGTGGTTSVSNSWLQLRKAGAAMRAMLVAAAAESWDVPATEITVSEGKVLHAPSGKSEGFGALSSRAATLPVPTDVKLKDPATFKLIGGSVARLDIPDKLVGKAIYSLDLRRPGQLTAVVMHPPRFGGRAKTFEADRAKKVAGVVSVVQIPTGVAVVAQDTWSALKGREALKVDWDFSDAESRSSDEIMSAYRQMGQRPGLVATERGDQAQAIAAAHKVIEAEFTFPYLAHSPMEPLNAVIEATADGAAVWTASQSQTLEQNAVAKVLGLKPEQVAIHTVLAGGSFGRRSDPRSDYIVEAAEILKATGSQAPVHLVRTREDDTRSGLYRTMAYHKVRAGLDAVGRVTGWDHVIVGKSIVMGTAYESSVVRNGVDGTTVHGIADTLYAIPNFRVTAHNGTEGVPILWWRSVGHSHTAHAMEVFIDELAHAAGKDAVAFRLGMLQANPRHAAVLQLAAQKAGWGETLAKGRGRGIAVHQLQKTSVAMVADVTVTGGKLKVDRIVAAADVGIVINPDIVKAQIEGAVGFALSSVLRNQITLKNGEVQQANFDTYEPTRIGEMPKVDVYVLPSGADPTGIGEPGLPCLAPAIANAVFAATGVRLRSLPLDLASLG